MEAASEPASIPASKAAAEPASIPVAKPATKPAAIPAAEAGDSHWSAERYALFNFVKYAILELQRGNEMAVRVKPVQPTEIKSKKMVREVIRQIQKPIPPEVYERHKKLTAYMEQFEK